MQDIYLTGGAMTVFGRHLGVMAPELAQEAILKAIEDAGVRIEEIQAIYCANVLGGMILGQLIVRDLGFKGIPVYNVENACASGATGVHMARHALLAQQYDTVLVFGIEQLTALGGGTIPLQRNDHKTELYASAGMVLPAVYAMRGTRFLHERGASPADLAAVAVKNRYNGSLNEFAQQRTAVTLDEVLGSRMIADPLTLLQCCAGGDGAGAVIISAVPGEGPAVRFAATAESAGLDSSGPVDLSRSALTASVARRAYERAGLGPEDIDVIELHDAFTIAELMYTEALGLCGPGEGPDLIESGETALDGRVAVNPSGGLLARSHPVGATGVAQLAEIFWQLRGQAGRRQTRPRRVGLTHTTGGGIAGYDHAACVIHVLIRDQKG